MNEEWGEMVKKIREKLRLKRKRNSIERKNG